MKANTKTAMLYLMATILLLCTACEGFESILATVKWDKNRELFHITLRIENVDGNFFECDTDAAQCVKNIEEALQSKDMLDIENEGVTVHSQTLAVRENILDVIIKTSGPITAEITDDLGIGIEYYGKPGREKPQWVLFPNSSFIPIELPKGTKHRLTPTWFENPRTIREAWVLPKHTKTATFRMGPDEDNDEEITPIFDSFPTLEKTLKERGILL